MQVYLTQVGYFSPLNAGWKVPHSGDTSHLREVFHLIQNSSLKISQNSPGNTCARVSFLKKGLRPYTFGGVSIYKACNFIKKEALAQVFYCEFCEISMNTFFYRTPPAAGSDYLFSKLLVISSQNFSCELNSQGTYSLKNISVCRCGFKRSWETFEQTWTCVKLWQENTCAWVSSLKKLQAGALQLYLNEGPAQLLFCEFCLISPNTYLQNICERLFLWFFSSFTFSYVKSCKTEKTMKTSASATMQMLINLRKTLLNSAWCAKTFIFMKQQLLVFCSAKYSSSCIVFIVFSA